MRKRICIDPIDVAGSHVQIDSSGGLIGELNLAKPSRTRAQEAGVEFGGEKLRIAKQPLGRARIDVDATEALDIEHPPHIEHVEDIVGPECDRSRTLALGDAVVEKLEYEPLVPPLDPGKKQFRNSRVRIDAVPERVIDRFVAPDFEPAIPCPLDEGGGRRDHEEEINAMTEARQQVAAGFVGMSAGLRISYLQIWILNLA